MRQFVLLWLVAVLAAPAVPAASASDGLPPGPGHEAIAGLCGACHSLRLVVQQRLDRASWDETLDWMVVEQGMPVLAPDERAVILDYLETHFGRDVPR